MNAPATALQFDYGEFPTLTTVRLRLRELRPSDRDGVFALRSDAEVQRYNSEPMRRIGEADAFIAEIGYDLARACWGRGIGAEAVGAVIRFGFGALRLHRLEADTLADNFRSVRMLERLGFVREGTRREFSMEDDGLFLHSAIYGLLTHESRVADEPPTDAP